MDRDDVSLSVERIKSFAGGVVSFEQPFEFSQFEKDAENAHRLEEQCELIIVLKKNCNPQVIECLLMYIAYAGLQFDVKRTPYGRVVVLLYAKVDWFDRASELLGFSYQRTAPKVTLPTHDDRGSQGSSSQGADNEIKVEYMYDTFSRNKRGQFEGQGGHMLLSRWRQFVICSILSAPVLPSCESYEGHVKSIIAKHSAVEANKAIEAFRLKLSPFKAADAIRDYCGEEVAFLFHFLAFLQYWLVLPALCGGILSCYLLKLFFEDDGKGVANHQFISRSVLSSAYGIAFMLYMSLLAEQWKRHSNDLCFKWGTKSEFQSKTRAHFQSSTKIYDRFSGVNVYVVSIWRRLGCIIMSIVVLLPIVAGTVLAHLGIMTWIYDIEQFAQVFTVNLCKDQVQSSISFTCSLGNDKTDKLIAACFLFGLVIAAQSSLTKRVAERLTNFENYQTHHEADKALLYKVLPVEYIAHFFPLFYIAFVVRNMNNLFQCGFWLFVATYFIKYIASIVDVILQYFWRRSRGLLAHHNSHVDIPLTDLILYEALGTFAGGFKSRSVDILASVGVLPVFDHMLQVVMQVSYASVFALSFPAGSFICLIIVFFQARILASKVLITGARHITRASSGIGMWLHTLEVVFFISVLVNGLICTVTSEVMSGIVFNFCWSPSSSTYWATVCDSFCELRLGNTSLLPNCQNLPPRTASCRCYPQIDFSSGRGGPVPPLNSSGPGSTELWAFMLYEHVVIVLKFFLMGSMPRFSQYINDMGRAQQLYMRVNATNEPAPLGNVDDNDAYDGDVTLAQTNQHFFVTQFMASHATTKETAAAIRDTCERPDALSHFALMPIEDSSL